MARNYSYFSVEGLYAAFLYFLVLAMEPGACEATRDTPQSTQLTRFVLLAAVSGAVAWHLQMRRAQLAQAYIAEFQANLERRRRSRKGKKQRKRWALHPGPGVWDDYAALFNDTHQFWASFDDDDARAEYREYLEAKFRGDFRLSTSTWTWLFNRVKHLLVNTGRDARGARPLEPELVMASAVWYLATGSTYREVTSQIRRGISQNSVMRSVRIFTEAVTSVLLHEVICFPTTRAGLQRLADSFERRSLIPGIVGCADGSHIRLDGCVPRRKQKWYRNRKGSCSVVLHGVVDPRGSFLDIQTGYPGSMGDSRILQLSPLWKNAHSCFAKYGFCLYGDAAYPLLSWMLTGYRDRANLPPSKKKFNNQGSRARVIVECAFGKLKSQWRCMAGALRTRDPKDWKHIIASCCILHNLTIERDGAGWEMGDPFTGGRPSKSGDGADAARDPDGGINIAGLPHIRDNSRAKAWRERIFDMLKKKKGWA